MQRAQLSHIVTQDRRATKAIDNYTLHTAEKSDTITYIAYLSADVSLASHGREAQSVVEVHQAHLHDKLVTRGHRALPAHAIHASEEE